MRMRGGDELNLEHLVREEFSNSQDEEVAEVYRDRQTKSDEEDELLRELRDDGRL